MEEAVIIDGARSAFGSFGGTLKDFGATEMGVEVAKAAIARAGVKAEDIGESIFGNVVPSGKDSIYLARHIGLKAGLKVETPALTVTRWGIKYGPTEFEDSLNQGLTDLYVELPMGMTAENLAVQYSISRQEQDDWASISQERAERATLDGTLKDEITPITIAGKNPIVFDKDEFIRGKASKDKMSTLKPAFKKDGTVTAGNASGINDGAGAVIVASRSYADKLGKKPLAIIKSYGHSGCDPAKMGIGPALAIPRALASAGLTLKDIGLVEVNEAFAAQYLAVQKELGLNPEITNVNGGAIAIGHPLGASGARVTLTLAYEMRRRKVKYGVASLCIGGGQGIAIVLENPNL